MRKLFFSVIALTIGVLSFTSCEDEKENNDDQRKEQKGKFLAYEDQQEIFSNTINSIAGSIEFNNLAQIANIVVEELGYPLNFDGAIEAFSQQDQQLAQKIGALKSLLESDDAMASNLDLEPYYFEADIAFRDSVIDGTTVYVPYLVKVNHVADRFLLNITAVDNHVYTLSFKSSSTGGCSVTLSAPDKSGTYIVPNLMEFSLSFDGIPVLAINGDYTSDFRISAQATIDRETGDTVVTSLIFDGNSFNAKGSLTLDKYVFSAYSSYSDKNGLTIGGSAKIGGADAISLKLDLDATITKETNWADKNYVMAWAMNPEALRGINLTAKLGGDEITLVAGLKESPFKYPEEIMSPIAVIFAGSQPAEQDIKTMVDKVNELLVGEVYFKGFDKPQATIKLAYAASTPNSGVKGAADDDDSSELGGIMEGVADLGLYFEVTTYDKDGYEIQIPASVYFSNINMSKIITSVVTNFKAAFGPLLEMLQDDDEEDYDYYYEY